MYIYRYIYIHIEREREIIHIHIHMVRSRRPARRQTRLVPSRNSRVGYLLPRLSWFVTCLKAAIEETRVVASCSRERFDAIPRPRQPAHSISRHDTMQHVTRDDVSWRAETQCSISCGM